MNTAPLIRTIDMLTGEHRPSKFFKALGEADKRVADIADAQLMRQAFAGAVGFYDCPCGSEFEFLADGSLEDYAALNRWLGRHVGVCGVTE